MVKLKEYDFYEHVEQGRIISLTPADMDGVIDPTAFLLAAVDQFSSIFRPLTAELTVQCVDPEWRFPESRMQVEQHACFMHVSWLPHPLLKTLYANPAWEEVACEEVGRITIAALSEWIARVCGQKCVTNPDYPVDWNDLWINTTCAQVFNFEILDVEQCPEKESLRMQCAERPGNVIDVPIRRDGNQYWVWGADRAMQENLAAAPFTVRLSRFLVEFHLEVHWSLWTEPASAGFQVICDTVQRLINNGWKVRFANEPFSNVFEVQPD